MTLAIRLVLGLSVLAAVGCSGSSDSNNNNPTVVPNGGSSGTAGAGAGGSGTTSAPGVPLTPTNGWVDGMSNTLGIQGAFFSYADPTSTMGMTSDVKSTASACIKGTAAKVLMPCTIVAPATDCYGTYWGAAIGFNLNQPNVTDPMTMMMVGGTPVPFDASAITGFQFDVGPGTDGTATLPGPMQFRFNIEDATTQYCSPTAKGVKAGTNKYLFTDVEAKCYASPPGANATTIQKGVVKISWQIATITGGTTPFDFCISNVRALTQ